MEKKMIWSEKNKRWEDEYGSRVCTYDNELIGEIINNCKEFLEERNTIYLGDICILLEKALEGIKDKKDLTPSEEDDIKRIRNKIKGL